MVDFHKLTVKEAFSQLKSSQSGLSSKEASSRLAEYGPNKLVSKKKFGPLKIFLNQFKSFLVLILIAAAIISVIAADATDSILIIIIVIINAALGFVQEYRAEKAMEALKRLTVPTAKVLRDGKVKEISSEEIVPGDIVLLESGDFVPADGRLVEIVDLEVDESSLTGESVAVQKQQCVLKQAAVADRKNMVSMGTVATKGRAKFLAAATGMETEFGKIAGSLQEIESETPLQKRLGHFGRWLGLAVIVIALATFILGIIRGETIYSMALTSITLAVAAVPEGLPAIVTVALALGTRVMARRNAIVRKLTAVESLGSVTVICSDKTGTLTTNEMTVRKILVENKLIEVTGSGFDINGEFLSGRKPVKIEGDLGEMLKIGVLCNDSYLVKDETNGKYKSVGDPTETALLVLGAKGNFWKEKLSEEYQRVGELPFTSERKMMTTTHKIGNKLFAYSKGAPEKILQLSKLPQKEKEKILEKVEEMGKNGLRVLAFSRKEIKGKVDMESVEKDLEFVGLVGMIDPPRKEVKEAIKVCRQAGIRVVMITGDHQITAEAIGKEIGLIGRKEKVLTGLDLDKMDYNQLKDVVKEVNVYARISPQHKLNIVSALKNNGEIVAVTGDGVNDAPALKKADVGIAMGIKGTDVSKEASDMVLADDNFSTIVSAVEEGRGVYDNIRKFVRYLLSVNFSEIFFITLTVLAGLPLPLLPVQILWINLLTDGVPALTLTADKKDPDIMKRKPRDPKKTITSNMKLFILTAGLILVAVDLAVFIIGLGESLEKARTMALTTTVLFELVFVFNCRSETKSVFRLNPLKNKYLVAAVIITLFLHLSILYIPQLSSLFGTVPLGINDWGLIIIFSLSGLVVLPEIFIKTKRY